MLVCIDHGNKQIKTTSRTFTSGLMESDTRPPFGDNIMFYRGSITRSLTSVSLIFGIRRRTTGSSS